MGYKGTPRAIPGAVYAKAKCSDCWMMGARGGGGGGGGGGGYLMFSAYVGSDPSYTVHPKKISVISSTPKNNLNFSNPKKYPNSVP